MSEQPDELVMRVRAELATAADPDAAPAMRAYVKSVLPLYGVRLPQVRTIVRAAVRDAGVSDTGPGIETLAAAARELFDHATHREERYAALALLALPPARGKLELLPLHQHFASAGAWWDLVDETAHRIADLHDIHPVETAVAVRRWSVENDMWLRRLAIISQLGRKDRLDPVLLGEVIEANLSDREFFIRKAIGWALREYAKVRPEWVRGFVTAHGGSLSPLSRREALKHLGG